MIPPPEMTTRSRKLAIGFGLLFAVTTSAYGERSALAQSPSSKDYPPPCASVPTAESERAHKLYEAGKAYYDDGAYENAIAQFREAYRKDCSKHELLIIVSRSYELRTDRAEAIRALETYLERVPNSPDAQQHRNRIDNLKRELAREKATIVAQPVTPPPKQEMREHTVPPWIVVGLGGAAIIAGIVVYATAPKLPAGCKEESKSCAKDPTNKESPEGFKNRQETAGQAKDQPIYGIVVIGAGAALVATGLLWHFLEPTGPVEAQAAKTGPKLTPQVAPNYGGLSLGGTF